MERIGAHNGDAARQLAGSVLGEAVSSEEILLEAAKTGSGE